MRSEGGNYLWRWLGTRTTLVGRRLLWLLIVTCDLEHASRLLPKSEGYRLRIDIDFVPPRTLVTLAVKLAMVDPAQRHCKLIRNSTPKRTRLRITKMVSLAPLAATYSARLTGNEF
jgi:hypothetical protein